MTQIKKVEELPYSAEQLFVMVTDIEDYPNFIPWCKTANVVERSPIQVRANIQGNRLGMTFAFSFIYMLQPNQRIDIKLLQTGPFQYINAFWKFSALSNQKTQLSLEIDYELNNKFLSWTLTPIIKNEAANILNEFRKRAKAIYG